MTSTRETFTTPAPAGAQLSATAGAGQLTGLAVPYGVTCQRYGTDVVFTRDSCRLPNDLSTVKLLVQHDDERPVGYATAAEHRDDGLHMTFQLAEHPRAAELAGEVDQLLRDGLSVGLALDASVFDQLVDRMFGLDDSTDPVELTGDLREVSAVSIPQFNDARASATARAAARVATFTTPRPTPTTTPEDPAMPTPPAPVTTARGVPVTAALPTPTVDRVDAPPVEPADLPTLEQLTAAVAERMGSVPSGHPMAAFASWTDYAESVWADPRTRFALADQVTTDNPGVLPPAWLSEIFGLVDLGAPLTTALSGGALPAEGMEVAYPYYDGDYRELVQQQLTEKTPIHSAKVSIKRGSADIETFAGGSDISYQLLRRSSPSYREAYNRILNMAYAWALDAFYGPLLVGLATAGPTFDAGNENTDVMAESFRSALFAASSQVKRATGRPADLVFASTDRFGLIGAHGLPNPKYGTQNVAGTASAATLQVDVNGLAITEVEAFEPGTVIVTNSDAARVYRDGPFPVSAEDVEKLGTNVAVWGMASMVTPAPRGVVSIGELPAGGGARKSAAAK